MAQLEWGVKEMNKKELPISSVPYPTVAGLLTFQAIRPQVKDQTST